jgi:glycosyltransferase involved in cell wall biosynthesis
MAMGKAVVSTTVGAEGLPVQSGENIVLADTPNDFANSVIALLRSSNERRRLGTAARVLVEENYSWKRVAEGFAGTLQDVVARANSVPRR